MRAPARDATSDHHGSVPDRHSDGGGVVGRHAHWFVSAAVGIAVVLATLSLDGLIDNAAWVPGVLTTVPIVLLAMSAARSLRLPSLLTPILGTLTLLCILTAQFFPNASALGFIPTSQTLQYLPILINHAETTIMSQVAPVLPTDGILLLTSALVGLITIIVDALAVTLRMPALSGLGLIALLLIPAVVLPESISISSLLAAGAGFLILLGTAHAIGQLRTGPRTMGATALLQRATMIAVVCIAATAVVPLAIPGFTTGSFPHGSRLDLLGSGTGLNPVVSLGRDLRNPQGFGRITYATNSEEPMYLRSVTLENFGGDRWEPEPRDVDRQSGLANIGGPSARRQLQFQDATLTRITTGSFNSPWLLAPYAPLSVNGLEGKWTWDPKTLTILGEESSTLRQDYEVLSVDPNVTRQQLTSAPPSAPGRVDDRFFAVPNGVPGIVSDTALQVTQDQQNPYEKALAIQAYLRGPDFNYSLEAPVDGGYDGNSMDVIASFLQERSGYCVHYAGAMAVMARIADIPSRIAIGYVPGTSTGETVTSSGGQELKEYSVNSRDAHAWPELYFEGIGWIPFEPTPSRGVVPQYAQENPASADEDPADALDPRSDRPVNDPSPSAEPESESEPATAGSKSGGHGALWFAAVVPGLILLTLVPGGVRKWRRRRAYASGTAVAAWQELQDTALDLGYPATVADTPRTFAARLASQADLNTESSAALNRVRSACEMARYGRGPVEDSVALTSTHPTVWQDLRTVREALTSKASRIEWIKATLWSVSLWRRP
ncbi:transglutaminaseTgpA domain-containing protein [Arthrobacter roseus]|uniref:transglutaminase family protein n=1 Tax=Arthrobacter roseus TaxID=136274 RepID=UPI0019667191|nr:DUF3488 and transglutaminase-like domain-containing protein [Arthrobacter roseus]MBM7848014.1 transglutaminase-like putative cysteine protease [Arthrobacter roseus]